MNFIEAIRSGFNNYFNFKERASKSAFWYFLLFIIVYLSHKFKKSFDERKVINVSISINFIY